MEMLTIYLDHQPWSGADGFRLDKACRPMWNGGAREGPRHDRQVIALIQGAQTVRGQGRPRERLGFSEAQAQAILDMRLQPHGAGAGEARG